jgi:hypothetical protein
VESVHRLGEEAVLLEMRRSLQHQLVLNGLVARSDEVGREGEAQGEGQHFSPRARGRRERCPDDRAGFIFPQVAARAFDARSTRFERTHRCRKLRSALRLRCGTPLFHTEAVDQCSSTAPGAPLGYLPAAIN